MCRSVDDLLSEAVEAGRKRNYKKSIQILENLAAQGAAEVSPSFSGGEEGKAERGKPEIYLYLSRARAAEKNYPAAISAGRAYIKRKAEDPAGWFFLGRSYSCAGQYAKSIYCLRKSLEMNPASTEAYAILGYACLKSKKPAEARAAFEKAVELAPGNVRINTGYLNSLFVEAVYRLRSGEASYARKALSFVIKNNIDGVVPRLYLAHALRAEGYLNEALGQYEAALQFAPDDPALLWYPALIKMELGDNKGALQLFLEQGIQIPERELSEQFLALGAVKNHMEKKEWKKAAQAALLYIKSFGSSAEIHLLMAEAQRNMGNVNKALNHYAKAKEAEPKNPYAFYGSMITLQESSRWEELAREVLRAESSGALDEEDIYYFKIITAAHIDNPPEEVVPHLQAILKSGRADKVLFNAMGILYVKLGMPELAINWYGKALELDGMDEEAKIGKIACLESLCMDKELTAAYSEYLEHWGSNTAIRRDYILFLEKGKNWKEAAEQLEILIGQVQDNHLYFDLARYRRHGGEYQKAAIIYRKMLTSKPEEPVLLYNLVYCLDKMGLTDTAIQLLKASQEAYGENPDTMLIEGILRLRTKNTEQAVRIFQYLAEKDPSNKQAAEFLLKAQNM